MISLAAAAIAWWLDVYVDARLADGRPFWEDRLEHLLGDAETLYTAQDAELDIACPIDLRVASITVYRPGFGGYGEGGTIFGLDNVGRPDARIARGPFARTRLYVGPGYGWAVGDGRDNWAWAWVGYWCGDGKPGCAQGDAGAPYYPPAALVDPWGRSSGDWAVAHELGHAARLDHRTVTREVDCSLMAYASMLAPGVTCENLGARLTASDCAALTKRAIENQTPGSGAVRWVAPPLAPTILEPASLAPGSPHLRE